MRRTILFMSLAVVLLAAACGGSDAESGGGGEATGTASPAATSGTGANVEFVATEFAFDPAEASVPADTDVDVSLRNDGNIEHDWAIKDQDTKIVSTPGQTGTGTINLPAGTYTFYCSIPGHEAAGMVGTLTVG